VIASTILALRLIAKDNFFAFFASTFLARFAVKSFTPKFAKDSPSSQRTALG